MTQSDEVPMPSERHLGDPHDPERGSTMLLVAIIIFLFLSANVLFARAQFLQAIAQSAQFDRLQATYAAEAGIYAAFDATATVPVTTLWQQGSRIVRYQASMADVVPPYWIESTGSVEAPGIVYQVRVRALNSGGRLSQWVFE